MMLCCAACAPTDSARVAEAAAQKAVLEADRLPDLPADCRKQERAGLSQGERLDVAVLKLDAALTRQNARGERCAAWFDRVRG